MLDASPISAKRLIEMSVAYGCDGWNAGCAKSAQVGDNVVKCSYANRVCLE